MVSEEMVNSAKPLIEATFNSSGVRAFKKRQIADIFTKNRARWGLPTDMGIEKLLALLIKQSHLRQVTLKSNNYQDEVRYTWREPSVHALALSIKNNSYLTHGTALFLQRLGDGIPRRVYVNHEQTPKPRGGGLSQESIDRAFAKPQKHSNLKYAYQDFEIVVINGKFSNRLEVTRIPGDLGEVLDATTIARTLIDITVRPAYAGGVFQVLKAFHRAKNRSSVDALVEILKRLDYLYPYHQALGFYMERAGYPENQWSKLMALGTYFDFHLDYQLPPDKRYDRKWKIYYPSTFDSLALHTAK